MWMNFEPSLEKKMSDPRYWFNFGTSASKKDTRPSVLSGKVLPLTPATPGSPSVATPTWDVERDTDILFREHGVVEIKEIEMQTRLDIDRRREDLRQMVGERYRDLIDAADSIGDMQKCSEQVKHSVRGMEGLCQKIQQTHFLKGSGGMRGPSAINESHALAAQLKLLADCPEEVWTCLEQRQYLKAAQHYLFAQHIYSQVGVGVGRECKGAAQSGVLQKLWKPVSCFKDIILECCNCHLQCSDLEKEPMTQSLCAIVLLEGCSSRQAFTKFLLARKTAIQFTFQPDSGSSQHRSVKNQVCDLVKTIVHSLLHIAAIFCQRKSPGGKKEHSLLLQQLLQFSKDNNKDGLSSILAPANLLPYLPSSIRTFIPTLRSTVLTEIPPTDIFNSTEDWITMCVSDVAQGVEKLLQYITSIKAISSIKSAIHAQLASSPMTITEASNWEEEWSQVCHLILNRGLSVWDTFFGPVLLQGVKVLLDKRFSSASHHAATQLANLLSSMASEPAQFQADIQCHSHLWKNDSAKKIDDRVELRLQSKSCTPSVYNFCQSLGEGLNVLIEDVSHYIQPSLPTPSSTPTTLKAKLAQAFPFLLYADTALLQDYIQTSTVEWITRFLQNVDAEVNKLQRWLGEGQGGDNGHLVDRLVMIGRLCSCLLDCCQNLSFLAAGVRHQKHSTSNRAYRGPGNELKGTASSADMLQRRGSSIFKIWAEWISSQMTKHLQSQISSDCHLSALSSSLVWSEVTISEEAESGKQISSVIHVPSQASTYVMSLLFTLCHEISRVGGHTIDRDILQHLSRAVMVGVVKVYESLLESDGVEMLQDCALQLLYNFRFMASVLSPPPTGTEEDLTRRIKLVSDALQSFVDPFDLDVFMPYVLANLENQLSRSSVMLGVLLALRSSSGFNPVYKPQVSSSESGHMILPLAPSVGRISLLPLSSKPSQPHQLKKVRNSAEGTSSGTFSMLQTVAFFHHL